MKIKKGASVLALAVLLGTAPMACQSKTEQKADEVTDDYKDLQEARQEGDSSDIREEKAELDSSRQEYRELAKDSTTRNQ